jgi:hypothetical protein
MMQESNRSFTAVVQIPMNFMSYASTVTPTDVKHPKLNITTARYSSHENKHNRVVKLVNTPISTFSIPQSSEKETLPLFPVLLGVCTLR